LAAHARAKDARVVSFGRSADADARLLGYEAVEEGSAVTADILGTRLTFMIRARGRHLASNAIAALAAAKLVGAPVEKAAESLARFEAPEGRGRSSAFDTPKGTILIIDESYNANPASMCAALEVLGTMSRAKFARRVAVLGDMLELGHDGPQFHADLASAIDTNGIDLVFCAGPLMANLYERLPKQKRGGWAQKSEDLRALLLDEVRGGDAVMIKGSLGSRMGQLAEALRLRFSNLAAA
ncbi:MAG: cyanophycin synthetase, partial [Rhodomicrobium sp.]